MNNSIFYISYYWFLVFILIIIFICIFFIPFLPEISQSNEYLNSITTYTPNERGFIWPIPGYYNITSSFGKRISPTTGASSYHTGIDIGAPEGTSLIAVCDR